LLAVNGAGKAMNRFRLGNRARLFLGPSDRIASSKKYDLASVTKCKLRLFVFVGIDAYVTNFLRSSNLDSDLQRLTFENAKHRL
jgi:hypothetical protein